MRSSRMPYSFLIAFLFIMEEEIEEWLDIKGFEGLYQISSFGRLKSFKKHSEGYILSNVNKTGWYLNVVLCGIGKKDESHKIHRLVGKYFIPNPDNKKYINHKDLNKQNNRKNNLEWNTCSENINHAINLNPNILKGINDYNRNKIKPIVQYSLDGVLIEEHVSGKDAALKTKVCERNIFQVASKTEYKPGLTRKQAGGFIWKYKQ